MELLNNGMKGLFANLTVLYRHSSFSKTMVQFIDGGEKGIDALCFFPDGRRGGLYVFRFHRVFFGFSILYTQATFGT